MTQRDFLGQLIEVGKTVVYPGRQGSRMWMNQAQVVELKPNGIKVQRPDGGIRTLTCLDRVVVVHTVMTPASN